jgi:hypothetical protein
MKMTLHTTPLALALALALAACHQTADLLNTNPVAPRSVLSLQPATMQGDTMRLAIALGAGPTRSVGSLTGDVQLAPQWAFIGCTAAQGEPLLACQAHGQSVKVAAAWATGTHTGHLVTLTVVRMAPSAAATWTLSIVEMHSVGGVSLVDSIDVRRDNAGTP